MATTTQRPEAQYELICWDFGPARDGECYDDGEPRGEYYRSARWLFGNLTAAKAEADRLSVRAVAAQVFLNGELVYVGYETAVVFGYND